MSVTIKVMERKGESFLEKIYLFEIFKGMWVTLGHLWRNLCDNSSVARASSTDYA